MNRLSLFISVIPVILLFAGCNQEPFFDKGADVTLKGAAVPTPLKGDMCMFSNNEDLLPVEGPIPGIYLSRTAWLNGNFTHLGKLSEQSSMVGTSAVLDLEALSDGKIVIVAVYEAQLHSANGDILEIISHIRIDVTDPENEIITGDYIITGGTGRWQNLTGSGTLIGVLPCWNVEGILESAKEK